MIAKICTAFAHHAASPLQSAWLLGVSTAAVSTDKQNVSFTATADTRSIKETSARSEVWLNEARQSIFVYFIPFTRMCVCDGGETYFTN